MSFNSFVFLFLFLPVVLIAYWIIKKNKPKYAMTFLVIASLVFYGYSYKSGLIILLLSLIVNYIFSIFILKKGNKAVLASGIIFNVLLLSLIKYSGVIFKDTLFSISAPGISFYSFCEIAFLTECYKKTIGAISLDEYAFMMTFFPKLMEGPITTPSDMLIQKTGKDSISIEQVYRAIMLFCCGCFKKVIIADNLGKAVDYGYSMLGSMHTGEALIIMLSYTLQLYFDFSGYCDMAMALANLLGFELPLNFNSPYKARNIVDFWKRWHISLTNFFTRYIYIPLGGNRKGRIRTYVNFIIIFFISGIWHGAGLTFIVWGLMHGVLYVLCRMIKDKTSKTYLNEGRIYKFISTVLTFIYVNVAWVFFRAPSINDAMHLFKDITQFWFPRFNTGLAKCFNIEELWYVIKLLKLDSNQYSIYFLMIIILCALLFVIFALPNAYDYSKKCRINLVNTMLMTVMFIWCVLSFEGVATYLYVNF